MFFVSGITGKVGGATAQALLDMGHQVRGLARDPAKAAGWAAKGVKIRQGDLTDTAAIESALDGVEGAFVMVPPNIAPEPGYPDSKAILASVSGALAKVPSPRVVALSSIGSEKTSGLGLITATHLLEQSLEHLPVPVAFVRAGSFLENFIGGMAMAEAGGVFYTMYAPVERAIPMIATVDIGRQVAQLLTSEWQGRRIIELGSPVSSVSLAAAMSEMMGKQITAQAIPREGWSGVLQSFGIPADKTGAYEEMMDGVNSGWIDFGVAGTEAVAGTTTALQVFQQARQGSKA